MFTARREHRIDKNLDLIDVSARVVLVRVGSFIAESSMKKLIAGDKVASGALLKSFVVTPAENIGGRITVRIGPEAPHGFYVHFGRKPGGKQPPTEAIRAWMKVRHIVVVPTGRESQDVAERRAAFRIARAIAVRGIKPFPFLKEGFGFDKKLALSMLGREMNLMLKILHST